MQQACFDSHTTKSKVDPDRQCLPTETRQEPEVSAHLRTKVGVQHAEINDEPTYIVITAHADSYSNAESGTPHPATPLPATWEPGNSSNTVCNRAASMPQGAISDSDSNTLDVPLPAFPSSQPSSVTTQHPTAAKSKSNSSLSSESVFVGNMENTADLSLESHTITNVTQTSRVKHGLIREGDQAAINTPQMSEVLKKIASVAQKQNVVTKPLEIVAAKNLPLPVQTIPSEPAPPEHSPPPTQAVTRELHPPVNVSTDYTDTGPQAVAKDPVTPEHTSAAGSGDVAPHLHTPCILISGDSVTKSGFRTIFTYTGNNKPPQQPPHQSPQPQRSQPTLHVQRSNTQAKKHRCMKCNYAGQSISHLKRHMLVHMTEKPYLCPYCGFESGTKQDLEPHMRKHWQKRKMDKKKQNSRT